jgi:hypothetical protein
MALGMAAIHSSDFWNLVFQPGKTKQPNGNPNRQRGGLTNSEEISSLSQEAFRKSNPDSRDWNPRRVGRKHRCPLQTSRASDRYSRFDWFGSWTKDRWRRLVNMHDELPALLARPGREGVPCMDSNHELDRLLKSHNLLHQTQTYQPSFN